MINPAYNITSLRNLDVVKEAKAWSESNFISKQQLTLISDAHPVSFFHPNFLIRILLFLAGMVALAGVTGLFFVMFSDLGEEALSILAIISSIGGFLLLEFLIKAHHHYKSGVTEAILYYSQGFLIGGIAGMFDGDTYVITIACLLVFSLSAIRYTDLISTAAAMISLAYLFFYACFDAGGMFQNIIPFVVIAVFTPMYFLFRSLKANDRYESWENPIVLCEALSLLAVYAGGNYFVVRELSVSMLAMEIAPGEDIPLAFLFYTLTIIIPLTYLYFGIRKKDKVLLRVSLALLAFSVFTFKYYYSTGHHEITFTVGGTILIAAALLLYRFLKEPRNGYTREQLRREKWADSNPEAFVISQTMGGNIAPEKVFEGGGGTAGGGGATGSY